MTAFCMIEVLSTTFSRDYRKHVFGSAVAVAAVYDRRRVLRQELPLPSTGRGRGEG